MRFACLESVKSFTSMQYIKSELNASQKRSGHGPSSPQSRQRHLCNKKDANRPFQNPEKCQSGQRAVHLIPRHQHWLLNELMRPWAWKSSQLGAYFNLFRIYFGVYDCVYAHEHRYPQKSKEGVRFHAAEVIDSWEPPCGICIL